MRNRSGRLVLIIAGLAWSTLFLLFSPPSVDAQQLKRVSQLGVIDVNDKQVGVADLSGDNRIQVVFQVDNLIFALGVRPDGFQGQSELLFETTDCSGTAWISRPDPIADPPYSPLPNVAVGSPGNTVYIPNPTATSQPITVQSIVSEDGCYSTSGSANAVQTQPAINLFTVFTPPFRVVRLK
jgi:hypothetical protein